MGETVGNRNITLIESGIVTLLDMPHVLSEGTPEDRRDQFVMAPAPPHTCKDDADRACRGVLRAASGSRSH